MDCACHKLPNSVPPQSRNLGVGLTGAKNLLSQFWRAEERKVESWPEPDLRLSSACSRQPSELGGGEIQAVLCVGFSFTSGLRPNRIDTRLSVPSDRYSI